MKCEITVYKKIDKALHPIPGAQYLATLRRVWTVGNLDNILQAGGSSKRVAAMRVVEKAADAGWL